MSGALYLAWRYLAFHRWKAAVLVTALTLILFIPVGLRVLVRQSSEQLRARAEETLGDRFDIRGFHDVLLADGAVSLPMLRAAVERWMAERAAEAGS